MVSIGVNIYVNREGLAAPNYYGPASSVGPLSTAGEGINIQRSINGTAELQELFRTIRQYVIATEATTLAPQEE